MWDHCVGRPSLMPTIENANPTIRSCRVEGTDQDAAAFHRDDENGHGDDIAAVRVAPDRSLELDDCLVLLETVEVPDDGERCQRVGIVNRLVSRSAKRA